MRCRGIGRFMATLGGTSGLAQALDEKPSNSRIHALDPGVKSFVREKDGGGNTKFSDKAAIMIDVDARYPDPNGTSRY